MAGFTITPSATKPSAATAPAAAPPPTPPAAPPANVPVAAPAPAAVPPPAARAPAPVAPPSPPSGAAAAAAAGAPTSPEDRNAERVKAVRDFFSLLRKGVKQIGMYRHDPKRFPSFIKPAQTALEPLLTAGQINLTIQAEAFVFDKEPVWAIEGGENIPGRFFREGIRQLTLRPGLTEEELNRLVAIMLTNPDRGDEEILSQLFNASFAHIGYGVAELFAFGELSEGQLSLELQKLIEDLEKRYAQTPPEVKARAWAMAEALDKKLEPMEKPSSPFVKDGKVATGYQQRVQVEYRKDESERLYGHLVALVLSQLKDGSLRDPAQAADVLAQLLDGMLQRSDLGPLGDLLGTLDEIKEAHVPVAEIKNTLGARMSEEPRVRNLAIVLNAERPDWTACARYLAECKPGASPVLLDILPGLENPAARALVLETVAGLDRNAGQTLSERLDIDGPAAVANLLALAERLPTVERGRLVEQAIRHPTPGIRHEAIKLLAKSSTPEAMLRFALDGTRDHDALVRTEAFRVLVELSPRRAVHDLLRLPKLPDWEKRPHSEKELIFECIGKTDTDEALRYVNFLLAQPKKGLFGSKRIEMKHLAIRALSNMPNLQSFKILQNVGALPDQDPEATLAAQKAAGRVRQAMFQAGEKPKGEAPPSELDEAAGKALELLHKRIVARQPPPVAAPAGPGIAPSSSIHSPQPAGPGAPASESLDSLDDLFGTGPSTQRGRAPTWASPGPGDPNKAGGK